jgi:hypothetical protein
MATIVPKIKRSVGEQPLPIARQDISAPDTGFKARVIERIGGQITQIGGQQLELEAREARQQAISDEQARKKAAELQLRIDKTTVLRESNGLRDFMRARESQWRNLKIDKAIGLVEAETKALNEFTGTQRGGLSSEFQRELYDKDNSPEINSYLDKVSSYSIQQFNNWEKVEGVAKENNAIQSGIESTNPSDFQDAVADLEVAVQTQGLVGVQADEAIANGTSQMLVGRIDLMLARDQIEAADAFYNHESVKKNIRPDQRDEVESRINFDTIDKQSQIAADEIMATVDTTTPSERMEAARAIKDPEVRDKTVKRVDTRNKELKAQKTAQDEEVRQDLLLQVNNAPTYSQAKEIAATADTTDVIKKGSLRIELDKLADSRLAPEKIVTNPEKINEARELINQQVITNQDQLLAYKAHATPADYKKLEEFLRNGGSIGEISYTTMKGIYKDLTEQTPEDDIEQFNAVYNYVEQSIRSTGKSPTNSELRKIMSNAIVTTPKKGIYGFRDPGQTLAEAFTTGTLDQWIADFEVPEDAKVPLNKNAIINRLQAENKRRQSTGENLLIIDEQAIKEYYFINQLGMTKIEVPVITPPSPTIPTQPLQAPELPVAPAEAIPQVPQPVTPELLRPQLEEIFKKDIPEEQKLTEIEEFIKFTTAPLAPAPTKEATIMEQISEAPRAIKQQVKGILDNVAIEEDQKLTIINNLLSTVGIEPIEVK